MPTFVPVCRRCNLRTFVLDAMVEYVNGEFYIVLRVFCKKCREIADHANTVDFLAEIVAKDLLKDEGNGRTDNVIPFPKPKKDD